MDITRNGIAHGTSEIHGLHILGLLVLRSSVIEIETGFKSEILTPQRISFGALVLYFRHRLVIDLNLECQGN
jgi:hypothetical protein